MKQAAFIRLQQQRVNGFGIRSVSLTATADACVGSSGGNKGGISSSQIVPISSMASGI